MAEFKRIVGKTYIGLLVCLLVFNMLILVSDKTDDLQVTYAYIEMLNTAEGVKSDSKLSTEAATIAWQEYFQKYEINGSDSSDKTAAAKQAREKLMQQAKYIDNYKGIIEDKRQTAILYATAGTYKKNSFEYNNLLKTQYDLSQIIDADVQLSNGLWLEKLYKNNYIHLLTLITCVYTVYMFFSERKNGLYHIVHTGQSGRGVLFVKRSIILLIQAVVTNVALYTESAVMLLNRYDGVKDLNVAAVSDEYFILTSGKLSRIQFLGLIILLSILANVVLSLVLWAILLCFGNVNIGLFFYCCICVADVVIYKVISAKSILQIFKYLNVYYLFFPNKAAEYFNWGCFNIAVSLLTTTIIVSVFIGILALFASAYISIRKYFTGKMNIVENAIELILTYIMRLMVKTNNFGKEVYKILISQGIIWILLLLAYIAANVEPSYGVIYDAKKSYMLGYYEKAEGLSYGTELIDIYNEYNDEYEDFLDNFDYSAEGAKTLLANRQDLFNTVKENFNYIKQMNEKGISAVVINPYEYTETIGNREWNNQELIAMINVIAAIVISCGFIAYEKKSMVKSLALTGMNRRKWLVKKLFIQSMLSLLFACITYGMYYKKLCGVYTYTNITAPLKSIMLFQNYIINPPIIVYIFIDFMIKYMFLLGIQMIMSVVSIYVKYSYCFIVGLVIILPQLLYMLGFKFMYKISIVKYMAFFRCWIESGRTMTVYWFLTGIIILIVIGATIYIMNVFQHKAVINKNDKERSFLIYGIRAYKFKKNLWNSTSVKRNKL